MASVTNPGTGTIRWERAVFGGPNPRWASRQKDELTVDGHRPSQEVHAIGSQTYRLALAQIG